MRTIDRAAGESSQPLLRRPKPPKPKRKPDHSARIARARERAEARNAALVPAIKQAIADGAATYQQIAAALNAAKIPTRSGKVGRWARGTVQ